MARTNSLNLMLHQLQYMLDTVLTQLPYVLIPSHLKMGLQDAIILHITDLKINVDT